MTSLQSNLNTAVDMIIDSKLEKQEEILNERLAQIEQKLFASRISPQQEIMQQKEVFELLGIGRRRLKNWVERGLKEIRVDNRVYYRYSDLINYIENSK